MNRIHGCPAEVNLSDHELEESKDAVIEHGSEHHCLFAPLHYEPNYSYPLIVWLHGPGDDEHQLRRVVPHISLRNYVAVAPRGCSAPPPGCLGFQWEQTAAAISEAEHRVHESITRAAERYEIAEDRIFIAGYDSGGTMALRIGLRHPNFFAGAISIGGRFPQTHSPLSQLADLRNLPILIAQGRQSEQYSLETICDELRLFHTAALQVTLRQYPCGDELTTQMLHDVDTWIMERISGAVTQSDVDTMVFPSSGIN